MTDGGYHAGVRRGNGPMAKATVLVVEDDDAIRELVAFHLCARGSTSWRRPTPPPPGRGVERVDAVVLDWMLPDASGIAWLRRLRAGERRPRRC
jgi:two-component system, OmpR family, phosphate regulon response regulator PhoB